MESYRIFISYSHEDYDTAKAVSDHLEKLKFRPIWDPNLPKGLPFSDQIKLGIAYAHVFLPIITKSANDRPWVQQEIGYAMGLNVPVLPLAIGVTPVGMTKELQALIIEADLSDLKRLTGNQIETLVSEAQLNSSATCRTVQFAEDRTRMLADYANRILTLNEAGCVRQRAALTSFSIPDRPIDHPDWAAFAGDDPLAPAFRQLLRDERRALQKHARKAGCHLMINLGFDFPKQGANSRKTRLRTLAEFLESMPDDTVRIAIRRADAAHNIVLVGDWLLAESMAPGTGSGWLQTAFTTHGTTVSKRQREFDEDLIGMLDEAGVSPEQSRAWAIGELKSEIG